MRSGLSKEKEMFFSNLLKEKYIDIVILIDSTNSMDKYLDDIKSFVLRFGNDFINKMESRCHTIVKELRIKIVLFRDYATDQERAFRDSGFFVIPQNMDEFQRFVNTISMFGGNGSGTTSALEALALIMRSEWTTKGDARRHMVFLITNNSARKLCDPENITSAYYPNNMPENLTQLGDMWHGTSERLKGMPGDRGERLILFTPNVPPWTDMQIWNNVWTCFSENGIKIDNSSFDLMFNIW